MPQKTLEGRGQNEIFIVLRFIGVLLPERDNAPFDIGKPIIWFIVAHRQLGHLTDLELFVNHLFNRVLELRVQMARKARVKRVINGLYWWVI